MSFEIESFRNGGKEWITSLLSDHFWWNQHDFQGLRIKSSLVFDPRVWQTNLPYFQLKEFHPVEVDLPYCNWYIISLSLSVLKFITYYSHVFAYSVFSAINTLYTMKLLCHILLVVLFLTFYLSKISLFA